MKIRHKLLIFLLLTSSSFSMAENFHIQAFDDKESLANRWKALILGAREAGNAFRVHVERASVHKDWFMRNAALVAMKEINNELGLELARQLIKDKALVVRSAAVEALRYSNDPKDRQLLFTAIEDERNLRHGKSLWIRPQILKVLKENPRENEAESFIQVLAINDEALNSLAVEALEKISPNMAFGNKNTKEKRQAILNHYKANGNLLRL